jgi:hypothetical protein
MTIATVTAVNTKGPTPLASIVTDDGEPHLIIADDILAFVGAMHRGDPLVVNEANFIEWRGNDG